MSKRILHLEASRGWGGQEIRTLQEAKGMKKRGYEIIFVIVKKGDFIKRARELGFVVYEMNYHKAAWIFSFFRLVRIIKKHQIDLVITHSSPDAWLGGMVAKALKKPVLRMRHLSTPIKKGWNSTLLYHVLADYVVTTCEVTAATICKQSGKKKAFCRSIPTGVDIKKLVIKEKKVQEFRKKLTQTPSDFLVGTMCFMRSWKGIDDFLHAANMLREDLSVKWVIIGGGHEEKYRQLAKDLHLEDIVTFTGHLENPFSAVAALDVFLLLSTAHEGVSQATLQAAYLQKPIIGTFVGGIPEVCLHNQTGLIVPTHSPKKVTEAVLQLKKNRNIASSMGIKGKQLVEKKFTYEKMLDQMKFVYDQLLHHYSSLG